MLHAFGGLPGGVLVGLFHVAWVLIITSRPFEATSTGFLDGLLSLFGYPSGSGQSLVDGSLRMRYCSANFSRQKPTWGLPPFGGVAALVSAVGVHPSFVGLSGSGAVSSLGNIDNGGRNKIRLTKKPNVRKCLELILRGSQFPNVGGLTLSGVLFFMGERVGSFVLGVGPLMLVSSGNWLIIRLHSPTPPGEVHVGFFQ